jgi:hypothetical protein
MALLEVQMPGQELNPMPIWVADERLYLNADRTKVCHEGDEGAVSLLCGLGTHVPEEIARRWGLGPYATTSVDPEPEEEEAGVGDDTPPGGPETDAEAAPPGEDGEEASEDPQEPENASQREPVPSSALDRPRRRR